jgi:UDP-glucose:(heptosyl)LPS alpha-1,3-glucosyltransferase
MRIPRIAVVVPKYGLAGGAERFAFEITERLALTGRYKMHVFANRWQPAEGSSVVFHKVPVIRFPRWLRPWSFPWFAQRAIDRGGFNLVHSHERTFQADVFSLHCVPHAGWVRTVREKRASLFDRAIIAVEQRMMRDNAEAWFLPVSTLAEDVFRREYRELPGRWKVMHPGVDVARFASPDREECRREIRERHGIGAADLLVLFVGMNFEVKGLDTILAALAKARTKANVRLLVVGHGDERKYAVLARSLGVAEAVTFVGTQTAGIERYYRAVDAFIMLSAFDTFGMVVLEAMAAGLPVIVSGNVGAKDLVVEGENGFVVADPQDSETASSRLVQLLDANRRDAMGAAAGRRALAHDWDAVVKELDGVYQDALARKAGRVA